MRCCNYLLACCRLLFGIDIPLWDLYCDEQTNIPNLLDTHYAIETMFAGHHGSIISKTCLLMHNLRNTMHAPLNLTKHRH